MSVKPICSACQWWHYHANEGDEANLEKGVGYCRRFPPSRRENGVGAWPITFGTDWCGEYAERKGEAWQVERAAASAR